MTTKKETDLPDYLPDYLVERLAAGDLPAERADAVGRRLELDRTGRERLTEIFASNRRILDQHPPSIVAHEVRRRALITGNRAPASRVRSVPARWGIGIGASSVVLAVVALALWLRPSANRPAEQLGAGPDSPTAGESDRGKGLRPGLRIYRKNAGKIERLRDGAPTHAGEQLQVAYVAAGRRYGVVLSVDGAGHMTYHLPATAGSAVRLRGDGEVALPDAFELDAAPGFERFVLVVGDAPFDVTAVTSLVRGQGHLPEGTVAASFTVRKE
jgi:hypothetical protein